MPTLYLLRHAKSSWDDPGLADHDRPLAQRGRRNAEALAEHGHSIQGREIPIARLLAVAETEREAEEIARQGAAWTVGSYVNPNTARGIAPTGAAFVPASAPDPIERYLRGVVLWGTPASLPERIHKLREEIGLEYLLCAPLSHGSFELFTDKVLPHL